MSRFRIQLPLVVLFALLVGLLFVHSVDFTARAEPVVTPTLSTNAWVFLPVLHGPGQPPPPEPTPTNTPTSTPTNTPEPGRLASPTLFDILNNGKDGNFVVGWSSIPDAEFYLLQQKIGNNDWKNLYEGPVQSVIQSNLVDGQYCYRVKAISISADSEWSAVKCTSVAIVTSTATPTATPGLGVPALADINNPDGDSNFVVEWASVANADEYILREGFNGLDDSVIFRGTGLSLTRTNLADGKYCYRVRAIILEGEWSDWSEIKCTDVTGGNATPTTPEPTIPVYPTPTSTPLPARQYECVWRLHEAHSQLEYNYHPISRIGPDDVNAALFSEGSWYINGQSLFSVEYKRAINDYPSTDYVFYNLRVIRNYASAVRLNDGRVLISGGVDNGSVPHTSSEIITIGEEETSLAGNLNIRRRNHDSLLLRDGRVLIWGGRTEKEPVAVAEIFDPDTNQFEIAGVHKILDRQSLLELSDNTVLVMGENTNGYPYMGLFDVNTGNLEDIKNVPRELSDYSNEPLLLSDGSVYIFLGPDKYNWYLKDYIFYPQTESFLDLKRSFPYGLAYGIYEIARSENAILYAQGEYEEDYEYDYYKLKALGYFDPDRTTYGKANFVNPLQTSYSGSNALFIGIENSKDVYIITDYNSPIFNQFAVNYIECSHPD